MQLIHGVWYLVEDKEELVNMAIGNRKCSRSFNMFADSAWDAGNLVATTIYDF
jgi:hypothetical protein